MSRSLRPVPHVPALRLGRGPDDDATWLVIADLHLGLSASAERPLGAPGAGPAELARGLVEVARRQRTDGLLIVGDAKHPIVGVPGHLRPTLFDFFADLLEGGLRVELVLGNHDGGIERHLPREVVVVPSDGRVRNGVGFFHGHRWPSNRVLSAPRLVTGHLHPGVRFAPTQSDPRNKQRAWVRVDLSRATLAGRKGEWVRAKELIVLPAYNPLCGTEALNRERPGRARAFLYRHFLLPGEARAYLLDGTDVGPIIPAAGGPYRAPRR